MKQTGGAAALGHENYESARRSYAKWQETNPQAASRYGFDNYVQYVQDQWASSPPEPENDRAANLAILARQMARVEERRAASQFYPQQPMRSSSYAEASEDKGRTEPSATSDAVPSRDTVQSHDESPQQAADEPTSSTSPRNDAATGGGDSGGRTEDDAAREIREIIEAAKAHEDAGRARDRERGRGR